MNGLFVQRGNSPSERSISSEEDFFVDHDDQRARKIKQQLEEIDRVVFDEEEVLFCLPSSPSLSSTLDSDVVQECLLWRQKFKTLGRSKSQSATTTNSFDRTPHITIDRTECLPMKSGIHRDKLHLNFTFKDNVQKPPHILSSNQKLQNDIIASCVRVKSKTSLTGHIGTDSRKTNIFKNVEKPRVLPPINRLSLSSTTASSSFSSASFLSSSNSRITNPSENRIVATQKETQLLCKSDNKVDNESMNTTMIPLRRLIQSGKTSQMRESSLSSFPSFKPPTIVSITDILSETSSSSEIESFAHRTMSGVREYREMDSSTTSKSKTSVTTKTVTTSESKFDTGFHKTITPGREGNKHRLTSLPRVKRISIDDMTTNSQDLSSRKDTSIVDSFDDTT